MHFKIPNIMQKVRNNQIELDFVIDELTNSIRNTVTGDCFLTNVSYLTRKDLKSVSKQKGWLFNWKKELDNDWREVYKH